MATASRIKMTYTAVLPAGRSIHDAQLAAVLQANGRAHLLAMDARAVEEDRERFDDDNQSARVQAPQACLRVPPASSIVSSRGVCVCVCVGGARALSI